MRRMTSVFGGSPKAPQGERRHSIAVRRKTSDFSKDMVHILGLYSVLQIPCGSNMY